MKDRHHPPVLIIGAHRSGTSAIAHALELLGLQIGQQLDSHCEPRGLQKLHEDYLRRVGAAWHNPQPFLKQIGTAEGMQDCVAYLRTSIRCDFGRIFGYSRNPKGLWLRARLHFGAPWGWKEPRTTLFASAWLEIFPQARLVHVVRNTRAAASSIRERELKFQAAGDAPTPNLADLDYCAQLVQIYLKAAEQLADFPYYRRVQFEELQANPPAMLERLANFCDLPTTTRNLAGAAASIRPARVGSTHLH
ncbi:MAG TPA: sulfotransferase [Chthoniobacterales bacterium]|nr:sulfotransferase [Chthoniobacterales bacterium]